MTLVDTHTHLYLDDFSPEQTDVVNRAIKSGVEKMIFPNVDLSTIAPMKALHAKFPENTYMAMGLHPTEITDSWNDELALIEKELMESPDSYRAVGEIGIDLYWDKSHRDEQMMAFARQVELALQFDLPIIIHCRDGLGEIIEVLSKTSGVPKGVFHSFGGTHEDVMKIREIGDFYFGINGIVTFKNSNLKDVLPTIGLSRILLETDSPYLAPVPFRGKRNESAYMMNVAQKIADVFGESVEKIAEITTYNAENLFRFGKNV